VLRDILPRRRVLPEVTTGTLRGISENRLAPAGKEIKYEYVELVRFRFV
jgi:hypothetical protein